MQGPQNASPGPTFVWMKFIPEGIPVPFKLVERIMIISDLLNQSEWMKIADAKQ